MDKLINLLKKSKKGTTIPELIGFYDKIKDNYSDYKYFGQFIPNMGDITLVLYKFNIIIKFNNKTGEFLGYADIENFQF